ncbi:MAG TPA: hypothetical protein VN765_09645, partial [Candidatus Acidoferrum sp.]|nr:hypothetical protein [Candidatus Acidoferrum sp.]
TTDFTDFTDENFAVQTNSQSVKSLPSVVQFFLVAASPGCVLPLAALSAQPRHYHQISPNIGQYH